MDDENGGMGLLELFSIMVITALIVIFVAALVIH